MNKIKPRRKLGIKCPEALKNFIAEHGPDNIPVIMVTGHGSERRAVEAVQSGAFNYIPKPIDADELVRRLLIATGEDGPREFVRRKVPRRLRHFDTDTLVTFRKDPDRGGTVMHLTCRDKPGLLSRIAAAIVWLACRSARRDRHHGGA